MITRCLPLVDLQPPKTRKGSINCIATASRATMPASGRTQFVAITDGDAKMKIMEVYSTLKSELLHDSAFEFNNESRQWINQMLDYNVPRGRLNRIFSVIGCYQVLQDGKESSDEESVLACVLGWLEQILKMASALRFIVKALELSNEEQKKILWENYGKSDPICIIKLNEIYAILDFQNVYTQHQKRSFKELKKSVEMHPSNVVQAIWRMFMTRMMNKFDESPQSVSGHSYC